MQKTLQTPSRVSRRELFLQIAELFGQRSTCPRAQVGAVAVQNGRIVATGYNGAPAGMPHCTDVGCKLTKEILSFDGQGNIPIDQEHCIRAVHAESNLIAWAAREGIKLLGADIYLTHTPCYTCSKLLVNCGVKSVTHARTYGHDTGLELLRSSNILVFVPPHATPS